MPLTRLHQKINELVATGLSTCQQTLLMELLTECMLATHPATTTAMTGAERVRLHRARKKAADSESEGGEGVCNECNECNDVTLPLQTVTSAVDNSLANAHKSNSAIRAISSTRATSSKQEQTPQHRGTRLPEFWAPTKELIAWALAEMGLARDKIEFETGSFRDWFHGQSGAKGVKVNWDLTWKNWMREVKRREDRYKPKQKQSGTMFFMGPTGESI